MVLRGTFGNRSGGMLKKTINWNMGGVVFGIIGDGVKRDVGGRSKQILACRGSW